MIVMKFTIELEIGLSYLLQSALPLLVTDRETTLIVVGGPSDRTAIAGAALRSRKRNPLRALRLQLAVFPPPAPRGYPARPAP
jgi:hypothetical protein